MHHTYNNGRATDVSGSGNHGLAIGTDAGAGGLPFSSSLRFDAPSSEVRVARSESLSNLDAIRTRVRFFWRPGDAALARRHNLIEGQVSFALYITPYGGLQGTILDAGGQWRGASAPKGTVSVAEWHEAELRHDGFSTLEIRLDGVLVAAAYDVRGPVRGVGPRGLSVGHWPEPAHPYTFRGFVDEVTLHKRQIEPEDLLDPCCNDVHVLDDEVSRLRDEGYRPEDAKALLAQAATLEAEIRAAAAGGDGSRAERLRELAQQGGMALQSGDPAALVSAATRTVTFLEQRMTQAQLEGFGHRAMGLLASGPYGHLLARLSKGRTDVPPGVAEVLSALCLPTLPEQPDKRRGGSGPEPEGDPDTDQGRPPIVAQLDHTLETTDEPAPHRDGPKEPEDREEPKEPDEPADEEPERPRPKRRRPPADRPPTQMES